METIKERKQSRSEKMRGSVQISQICLKLDQPLKWKKRKEKERSQRKEEIIKPTGEGKSNWTKKKDRGLDKWLLK